MRASQENFPPRRTLPIYEQIRSVFAGSRLNTFPIDLPLDPNITISLSVQSETLRSP
jgi:hypothetical protein